MTIDTPSDPPTSIASSPAAVEAPPEVGQGPLIAHTATAPAMASAGEETARGDVQAAQSADGETVKAAAGVERAEGRETGEEVGREDPLQGRAEQEGVVEASQQSQQPQQPTIPLHQPEQATSTAPPSSSSPTPEDLARQLASFVVPSTSTAPPVVSAPVPAPVPAVEQEEEWPLKEICWPPLPPTPDQSGAAHFEVDPRLRVKVICQNRNGPCSLIALCAFSSLSF
jgi:hypothetical protein